MHIAFWSPGWPLEKYQSGVVTYVHWMRRGLEAQGHRVSIFTQHRDPSVTDPYVHQVNATAPTLLRRVARRLNRSRHSDMRIVTEFASDIATSMRNVHARDPIDVVEMEESFGWFAQIASQTGIPLAVKLHGPAFLTLVESERGTQNGRERIEAEGAALRQADTIVSPSRATLDQSIARYRLTPRAAHHIVNPIVIERDTPLWALDSCEQNTVLFVGRFDLCKGADVMLRAFQMVLKDNPALRLVFVGPDRGWLLEDGTRVQFTALRDVLFPLELRSRIDYRGALPNREVAALRTKALVTVVASRWENQAYTLLEAMIQGCPVVCTDAGGCSENVVDGVSGRLARSEDATDFARQLLAVVSDKTAAAAMGAEARRQVLQKYSLAEVVASSLDVFRSLIDR
jgi:glycosyltransferase involved in cell wall biosynthesis